MEPCGVWASAPAANPIAAGSQAGIGLIEPAD